MTAARQRGIKGAVAAAALVATVVLAPAGIASQRRTPVEAPFTLASGFQQGYGAGTSALGPDGTAWLAQPGFGVTPSSGFEILAHGAGGRSLRAALTSDGPGSATDHPVIATTPGGATFVWQTTSNFGGSAGTAQVRARSCSLRGCGPIQVLAQWRWSASGRVGGSGFTAVGDAEPGVAGAGDRVVAVFDRDGGASPGMAWAVSAGGRFGAVHPLGGPAGPAPAVSVAPGGGVLAAWIVGNLASFGTGIRWASWSPRGGFSEPRGLAGATGLDASLLAAPAGAGVALAWQQGAGVGDPTPAGPVWVSRRGASGAFSSPLRVFGGDGRGLSVAGASGTLALGFSTATISAGSGPAWVKRSTGGGRFARAADLDPAAAQPPTVAVVAGGSVLAAWSACRAAHRGAATCTARLAIASPRGGFAAPVSLGGEDRGDAPAIHANGGRALVTWESGGAVHAVVATPER